MAAPSVDTSHDLSSQYGSLPPEPFTSFNALKDRIKHHYEICSEYYYSLWYVPPVIAANAIQIIDSGEGVNTFTTAISSLPRIQRK